MKQGFIALAKCHFAKLLGIKESQVAELYDFVNAHFYIKIISSKDSCANKPPSYRAALYYAEDVDVNKAVCVQIFGDKVLGGKGTDYSEFATSEAALRAACKYVNAVKFTPSSSKYPDNMLILFNSFFPVYD